MSRRTILGIFSHPDDESMGPGATLAKYAAAGHRVAFVSATDGGAGRLFEERPRTEEERRELRRTRREETRRAAEILGVELLGFLGWDDRGLAAENLLEVEEAVAALIRREKPDVLITFHPSGISYHPDHRVITLATLGAFLGSGRPDWYRDGPAVELAPHAPAKLYAFVPSRAVHGWEDWPRQVYVAPPEELTTVIDTADTADVKWEAIQAHASQQHGPPFRGLWEAGAFREESFVRLLPTLPPGAPKETDLLEGLSW